MRLDLLPFCDGVPDMFSGESTVNLLEGLHHPSVGVMTRVSVLSRKPADVGDNFGDGIQFQLVATLVAHRPCDSVKRPIRTRPQDRCGVLQCVVGAHYAATVLIVRPVFFAMNSTPDGWTLVL